MVSGVSDTLILTLATVIFAVIYALLMQIRVQVRAFGFRVHRRPLPRNLLEGLRGRRAKELHTSIMSETWALARGDDIDRVGAIYSHDRRSEVLEAHERLLKRCGVRAPEVGGSLSKQEAMDKKLRVVLEGLGLFSQAELDLYFAIIKKCRYSDEEVTEQEWGSARAIRTRASGATSREGPGRS